MPLLEEKLVCRTTAEWLDVLEDAGTHRPTIYIRQQLATGKQVVSDCGLGLLVHVGVPAAPEYDVAEMAADPHTQARTLLNPIRPV